MSRITRTGDLGSKDPLFILQSPHSLCTIFSLKMEPSAVLVKTAEPDEAGLSSLTRMLPLLERTTSRHRYLKTD